MQIEPSSLRLHRDDVIPDAQAVASISFVASKVTTPCAETDTVLAVAKCSGLSIPSACSFGLCGTCKVRKTSGDLRMVHNGSLSDEEDAAGFMQD